MYWYTVLSLQGSALHITRIITKDDIIFFNTSVMLRLYCVSVAAEQKKSGKKGD